jgi:hypothetical protein
MLNKPLFSRRLEIINTPGMTKISNRVDEAQLMNPPSESNFVPYL